MALTSRQGRVLKGRALLLLWLSMAVSGGLGKSEMK